MTKRLIIMVFSAALLLAAITGCNTVRGAGEDIESAGSTISGAAGGGPGSGGTGF